MGQPNLTLSFWTDDPELAAAGQAAGIDRIGPDLELVGKAERQAGYGYRMSCHSADTLSQLRAVLGSSQLFVRTNPLHAGSPAEIAHLLAAGVDVLMLPMFRTAEEVARYAALVDEQALIVGLLEHADAVANIDAILDLGVLAEIHIGLNDLALSVGEPNRFALLESALVGNVAAAVHRAGVPLGVGGIGRVGDTDLPVASGVMYRNLARLGATATLVARSFLEGGGQLGDEVTCARAYFAECCVREQGQ